MLVYLTDAIVHYVVPNGHHPTYNGSHTLQYYMNDITKYFTSHAEFCFLPGKFYLNDDLVIANITNFTMHAIGNRSIISCDNFQVGIIISNVSNLTLHNIAIFQCSKNYSQLSNTFHIHYRNIHPFHWIAAIHVHYCVPATINNVSIIVTAGVNGLLAVNVAMNLTNLKVQVDCTAPPTGLPVTDEILLYYYNWRVIKNHSVTVSVKGYVYKPDVSCSTILSQCAMDTVLTQSEYNVNIKVLKSIFSGLYNAAVLKYYGESIDSETKARNYLTFSRCQVSGNIGNSSISLLQIVFHNNDYIFGNKIKIYRNHYSQISIAYCIFFNNTDIKALIDITPINTLSSKVNTTISNCNFYNHHVAHVLRVVSRVQTLLQFSHLTTISSSNISFNIIKNGVNLILSTNGILIFSKSVIIRNNTYFTSVIKVRFTVLKFSGHCQIFGNQVKYIFTGLEGSYYLLNENSIVNVTQNLLYAVIQHRLAYDENDQIVCIFQFLSKEGNLDKVVTMNETLNYAIVWFENRFTAPSHLSHSLFDNCTWLTDTAFDTSTAQEVFGKIMSIKNKAIGEDRIGIIPSYICHCTNSSHYNCSSHEIGAIYPGQTLRVRFIMPNLQPTPYISTRLTVVSRNRPREGCDITEGSEISQSHDHHGCNEYNYTVWSNLDKCELYLESDDSTELFYVHLKSCPLGFSLQKQCSLDPVLASYRGLSITSYNIDDETIVRPANSYISADIVNDLYVYHVSPRCPFDYCLPHPTNLDLSNPNAQCQFDRGGVLCGQCPEGLSSMFGSSQCKRCSNGYVFIIVPIAIAGVVVVLMLFIFNLTVANGSVNTFIFYINIITINFSVFFPECESLIVRILISVSNLDLGVQTCFYDGMDSYAKMWFYLTLPLYLIIIALLLIIGSRYSTKIQRLTAHNALPVLATIFLLAYTKALLTVCSVLFLYCKITHLPSGHTTVMWSVDTGVPFFGVKFTILFVVCLLIFLIMLPFNFILLFNRKLSWCKWINTFKPLLDAYLGPYKDKYSYWTGLQLLIRAIFLGLSACHQDVSLTSGIIILGSLLCVQGVVHPFKSRFMNIQESLVSLNLLAVHVTALHNNGNNRFELFITKSLIYSVFAYYLVFIICHCVMSRCGTTIKQMCNLVVKMVKTGVMKQSDAEFINMKEYKCEIPDVAYDYQQFQEPLVALTD